MVILLRSRHLPAVIDRKRSFGWGCPFPQRARRLRCGRQAMGVAWRLVADGHLRTVANFRQTGN